MSGMQLFCAEHRQAVREENPRARVQQINRTLAERWMGLDEDAQEASSDRARAMRAVADAIPPPAPLAVGMAGGAQASAAANAALMAAAAAPSMPGFAASASAAGFGVGS
jgi:hypothetical protein